MSFKSAALSSNSEMGRISSDIKKIITELRNGCWEGPAFSVFSTGASTIENNINSVKQHFEIYVIVADLIDVLELIIQQLDKLKAYKSSSSETNEELDAEIVIMEEEKSLRIKQIKDLLDSIVLDDIVEEAYAFLDKYNMGGSKDLNGDGIVDKDDGLPRSGTVNEKFKFLFPDGKPRSVSQAQKMEGKYIVSTEIEIINSNGERTTMKLRVHKELEEDIKEIFSKIADLGFRIKPSTTAAYNARLTSTGSLSHHSYGTAIDINWDENPYLHYDRANTKYDPTRNQYAITEEIADIFRSYGWSWGGGDWNNDSTDYMHFSFTEKGSQGHKVLDNNK